MVADLMSEDGRTLRARRMTRLPLEDQPSLIDSSWMRKEGVSGVTRPVEDTTEVHRGIKTSGAPLIVRSLGVKSQLVLKKDQSVVALTYISSAPRGSLVARASSMP